MKKLRPSETVILVAMLLIGALIVAADLVQAQISVVTTTQVKTNKGDDFSVHTSRRQTMLCANASCHELTAFEADTLGWALRDAAKARKE